MNRNKKSSIVSEVTEMMEKSTAIFLTDYSGINVEDINDLRNQFRNEGVKYKVFKNTLFKRALEESGKYEKLADHLVGMTAFAFTDENPVAPAKIIKKYFDKNKKRLEIRVPMHKEMVPRFKKSRNGLNIEYTRKIVTTDLLM